ncbi:FAD-binding oxidoreductase [Dactylosporangium sp. AC04546]|uniref:FAD-binding oxidoreductase n=1 Tax=Dactylosporangium sp. AC04546 TaxID=2862460 RepID=UPI001EDEFCF9|nr:FAD-binding oxidoreductase [Dactylosporangium sp. AC04546]WVK89005.1 FAD-binding oxidoreductase [Dactylosporangium sp. AC04546]
MLEVLRRRLGAKVSTRDADLDLHSRDENYPVVRRPAAVVYAEHVDDVLQTLAWSAEYGVAVIPFGAGSSAEGHVVPLGGEVSLNLSRMNRVVSIQPPDFLAVVQPGLTRMGLNRAVRDHGLFFPVDPGADASLGGMAATNASGTTTVRYGGMRQNVAALQVALADGRLVALGRGVRKTSSGYDLKDLLIGSAGTLGVITELTVALHPTPSHVHTQRVFFSAVPDAVDAAYAIMGSALPVARLELVDALSMRAINRYLDRRYPEQPALFVELHASSAAAMAPEAAEIDEIVREHGARSVSAARDETDRQALWEARHQLYPAIRALYPHRTYLITDTAVPLAAVSEMVAYTGEQAARLRLDVVIAGHVADGNVHSIAALTEHDRERADEYSDALVERALALGGTSTGEHGIGLSKRKYLRAEHGEATDLMIAIKHLFDPRGLLNPGKVVGG